MEKRGSHACTVWKDYLLAAGGWDGQFLVCSSASSIATYVDVRMLSMPQLNATVCLAIYCKKAEGKHQLEQVL